MALLAALVLVAGAAGLISTPHFLPKIGLAGRVDPWNAAIQNVRIYGPLGIGPGQPESLPGMAIHNIPREQQGEAGILTTTGVVTWLILPIIRLRQSRLASAMTWSTVATMAGVPAHGLLWSQFLNGSGFPTRAFVCLCTALAT